MLAGGQSLVPVLAMRLAAPAHLVDINRIAELDAVRADADGVTVGALARHRAGGARPRRAARRCRCCAQALRLVAHPTIRNRGTTVGSLAHADPAGEMTAVLALCGGTVTAASAAGAPGDHRRRTFSAVRWNRHCAPDELAVEAFFPALPRGAGTAFVEIARRHGDYALCGVGAIAELDGAGAFDQPALRVPVGLRHPAGARPDRRLGAPASRTPPSSARRRGRSADRPARHAPTTAGIWPGC